MKQPELIVNLNCLIGEGPCYDEKKKLLYWLDVLGNKIHSFNLLDKSIVSMELDQNVGSIVVREKGGLLVALQNGFYGVDIFLKTVEKIIDPEDQMPNNRFNDGKCDCMGRFWAGTMSKNLDTGYGEYKPEGNLYCLYPDLHVERKLEKVVLSNGLGWSPDNKTMYFIDSPTMAVAAFDYEKNTGTISNQRIVINVPKSMGMPDGLCVDSEGMVWVALWGGGSVTRWNPMNGQLLETISLPTLNVTCCAFGGDNLDELFITTARNGTDIAKYPDAGGLFRVRPGTTGLPSYTFQG